MTEGVLVTAGILRLCLFVGMPNVLLFRRLSLQRPTTDKPRPGYGWQRFSLDENRL